MSHQPSRYVQPDVNEARIGRLWSNVSERLEQRPARGFRWLLLGGALTAAAAGAVFFAQTRQVGPEAVAAVAGARLETGAEPLAVTLVDGSKLSLSPQSELEVRGNRAERVSLSLGRGKLECDVEHQAGRSFSVLAGDVEVRVVGTKFSVTSTPEAEGSRVEVSVLRGVVEIRSSRRPGIVARVAAGQSWLQLPESSQAALAPAPTAPVDELSPETPPKAEGPSLPAPSASQAVSTSARELFEKAGERRRAGDAAGAARAYEELLRAHPGDARASLSSFELGRLRMDRLGDSAGAIAALERAVSLNVGPTFREDALARLVSVYATQGNFAACARARDRYLSSYPTGVHAAAVGTRCGAR